MTATLEVDSKKGLPYTMALEAHLGCRPHHSRGHIPQEQQANIFRRTARLEERVARSKLVPREYSPDPKRNTSCTHVRKILKNILTRRGDRTKLMHEEAQEMYIAVD